MRGRITAPARRVFSLMGPQAANILGGTIVIVLGACTALPPPPLVPFHATTEPDERGVTSAMLIVGGAGTPLDFGLGAAVRIEHQATDRTAVGFDLVFGRTLDPSELDPKTLVGVRGFARTNPTARDWFTVTYGVGLSYLDSGNLTASVHAGGVVAATNETFVPYATLGVAPVFVLKEGRAYARNDVGACIACSAKDEETRPPPEAPRSELFLYGGIGFVAFVGGDNRLSLDLGLAMAMRKYDASVMSVSIADAQR
ncbi:MAG TPA: hypothetical protein VIV11_13705 [Kofleriaceae bacterium]